MRVFHPQNYNAGAEKDTSAVLLQSFSTIRMAGSVVHNAQLN